MSLKNSDNKPNKDKLYPRIKMGIDFIIALVLLVILAIPMAIIAIAIKIEDKGPVIYTSDRVGKDLKMFKVYKFRSMKTNRKELASDMTHREMVTKVGKFIRKTSLDELPQLFNILKCEMSFIGPRPWVKLYYDNFTEEQNRRSEVLPGMTGLAQANGRNGISVFERIDYDIYYVDNISFGLDCKVIFLTIKQLFKKGDAEMTENGIRKEIRMLRENKEKVEGK